MKRARVEHALAVRGIGFGYVVTVDPEYRSHTPWFSSKEECVKWVESYVKAIPSHPSRPDLRHLFTTWVCWQDILRCMCSDVVDAHLFPECLHLADSPPASTPEHKEERGAARLVRNTLWGSRMHTSIRTKLSLPVYTRARFDPSASANTMRYLFHHMRCGIYVRIRNNTLQCFVPFANETYTNTWHSQIRFRNCANADQHVASKRGHYGHHSTRHRLRNPASWWANAGIVCETPDPQIWGDTLLAVLRRSLEDTCGAREVPDCEFYINKRDHPQLRAPDASTDAQRFLWSGGHPPSLVRESHFSHAPLVSFYTGPQFADLAMPTHEDWMTLTGGAYPPTGQHATDGRAVRDACEQTPWCVRMPKAVWRGSDTGPKQRTRLCNLCEEDDFLGLVTDVAITQWSSRDRIDREHGVVYFDVISKEIQSKAKAKWMPVEEQIKYKYTFYLSGHSAASRLASMMLRGSLILYVQPHASVEAHRLWFDCELQCAKVDSEFNLVTCALHQEGADHGIRAHPPLEAHVLVVEQDLSNLKQTLQWCLDHDGEASAIAANGLAFGRRLLGDDSVVLDYMQLLMHEIAQMQRVVSTVQSPYTHPWSPRMMDICWPPGLSSPSLT